MIKLFEMAKFVDNDVIEIFFRKVNDFIVEIEIALPAAASPSCFLIADRNSAILKIIHFVQFFNFQFG